MADGNGNDAKRTVPGTADGEMRAPLAGWVPPETLSRPAEEASESARYREIDNWFTYHAPSPDQIPRYDAIRRTARIMARVIWDQCPPSADRTAAIRKLRECVMTANASIACGGK